MESAHYEEDIPQDGTPERTRLAASAIQRRQRQAYGGSIQWEAAFFGWLVAIGLAAILIALVVGAGVAVGLTDIENPAGTQAEQLTLAGGAVLIAILAIAYLAGGYVAGRMARFDGWRQGLGVWIVALAMTAVLGLTAWIGGGDVNPLESLDLPRIPVEENGDLTRGGEIALGIAAVTMLVTALLGGILGERFHRAVDEAGAEYGDEEASVDDAPEPAPEGGDGPDADDKHSSRSEEPAAAS